MAPVEEQNDAGKTNREIPAVPAHANFSSEEQKQWRADEQRLNAKTFASLISGGIAGFFGMFGAEAWVRNKLRPVNLKALNLTRDDVLSINNGTKGNAGNIGAGLDAPDLKERHIQHLITTGEGITAEEQKLAKIIDNVGGKSTFALGVGAIVGLLVAIPVWLFSFRRKDTDMQPQPISGRGTMAQHMMAQSSPEVPESGRQFAKDIESKSIDPASIAQKKAEAEPAQAQI